MYCYDSDDQQLVEQRVAQFRDQTARYLQGTLTDAEFLPLRLQNGLYIQRLAPMLRIAVPYGMISSDQLRTIARLTRDYDKGYAHISTRQNIQFNWPAIEEVPDLLAELATVEMHAIQTSGNCIRNITTDQFAGIAVDELEDPRPWCELIRQWACFHPEFAFLPRKFKIAVSATNDDRAAIAVHDIGLRLTRNYFGKIGFRVFVGGGLGRTPAIAAKIKNFIAPKDLLNYLEAILRVYNLLGRRDNRYKARIKILVRALGIDEFKRRVEKEWKLQSVSEINLDSAAIKRMKGFFTKPNYKQVDPKVTARYLTDCSLKSIEFARWLKHNTASHVVKGYAIVTVSLKKTGEPPGDISDGQMEVLADLADKYSGNELRTTHEQNIVLGDVSQSDLYDLWQALQESDLATSNINTINDIICCPGGDYCSLANAKSIPVADAIQRCFDDYDYLYDLGPIDLNISGCMNACGHHHVGHIGILGVDKKGEEFYQISLGGNAGVGHKASLGKILGPSFAQEQIPTVVKTILDCYVDARKIDENFLDTYNRIGINSFKEKVYG